MQDQSTGKAVWAAATKQAPMPDGFVRFGNWKAGPLPYNKRVRWQAKAPKIEGLHAALAVVASAADARGRLVRVKLARGGADGLLLRFDEKTPVLAMGLPGKVRVIGKEADKGPSFIRCSGRSCDGLKVDLLLGTKKAVTAMLVAQRFVPPREAAALLALRPNTAQPQYSPDSQVDIQAVKL